MGALEVARCFYRLAGEGLNVNNIWRYHKGQYRHWLREPAVGHLGSHLGIVDPVYCAAANP